MWIYWTSHWKCSGKKGAYRNNCLHFWKFLKNSFKVVMWICGQNPKKIPVKKFSFSKFAGFQRITWLQKNFFRNIFQGFSPHIPEHLFCSTALTRCFWCNYLWTIYYRPIMTLQCVIHYQHLKTRSKIIPLNQHKFKILNQNRETRPKFVGESKHKQQQIYTTIFWFK